MVVLASGGSMGRHKSWCFASLIQLSPDFSQCNHDAHHSADVQVVKHGTAPFPITFTMSKASFDTIRYEGGDFESGMGKKLPIIRPGATDVVAP